MRKSKLVVSIVMVMAMLIAALAGCSMNTGNLSKDEAITKSDLSSSQSVSTGKKIKVAYSTMTFGAPYFVEVGNGMKAAGEKLGWEVSLNDPKGDVAAQVSALENYIAQDYDLIFLSALDTAACAPLVKKAADAGIPVITEATIVAGTAAHVGPGEKDMGMTLGKAVGEWCKANLKGKIKVATYNVTQDPNTKVREQGMREGIEQMYGKENITYVASLGALTPEDGIKNVEGILQSNPDLNVVMGCNDDGVMGSYQAAKSAGADLTKMCFGGINAIPQALDLMKSEKGAGKGAYRVTVDIVPFKTGEICIDIAKRVLEGEKFTETVGIPTKPVTWDNILDYFK